jgi:nucleotide-binding universal stress UspA family protein
VQRHQPDLIQRNDKRQRPAYGCCRYAVAPTPILDELILCTHMKILVATDGSKPALQAVKFACKLVRELSSNTSSITLISVHDDAGLRHAKAFVGSDAVADYLRELSEKELKPARKLLAAAGIRHDMEVRTGHVAQEIVHCAKTGKFDLIVVGAKGRSAIADLLLGSVAQRVMATAETPVVLAR